MRGRYGHVLLIGNVANHLNRGGMSRIEPRLVMLHDWSNGRAIDLDQRVSVKGRLNR